MNIGIRIKDIRQHNNLSQTVFCQRIGISQGTLSDIEGGKTKPSFETLVAIKNTYSISLDWLMAEDENSRTVVQSSKSNRNVSGLTAMESGLLENYRKLDARDQSDVLEIVKLKANRDPLGKVQKLSTSPSGESYINDDEPNAVG